jgi:hypothetical protein
MTSNTKIVIPSEARNLVLYDLGVSDLSPRFADQAVVLLLLLKA